MEIDRPGPTSKGSTVRLTWPPGTEQAPAPARSAPAKTARATAAPAKKTPATKTPPKKKAAVKKKPGATGAGRVAGHAVADDAVVAPTRAESHLGGVFVEAFDRLADRLLDRIRSLRLDIDADVTSVRSDVAGLHQAVDAIGDRVQMRHIRASLDEIHSDVVGLRRAVLEWPELEQMGQDLLAVRDDLALLLERQADLSRLVSDGQPGGETHALALDDEQLERIVSAVAARVTEGRSSGDDTDGRRGRWR